MVIETVDGFELEAVDIAEIEQQETVLEAAVEAIEEAIEIIYPGDLRTIKALREAKEELESQLYGLSAVKYDHAPQVRVETYVVNMEKDETVKMISNAPASLVGIINPNALAVVVSNVMNKHEKPKMRRLEFLPEENESL